MEIVIGLIAASVLLVPGTVLLLLRFGRQHHRTRREERFPLAERAIVETGTRSFSVVTEDLSASGARIRCVTALKPGSSVVLHVRDAGSIPATVLRRETGTVALSLAPSPVHHDALLRKLQSFDRRSTERPNRLMPILGAIRRRLVGSVSTRWAPPRQEEPAVPAPAPVPPAAVVSAEPQPAPAAVPGSNILVFTPRRTSAHDRGKSAAITTSPNLTRAGVRDLPDPA